MSEALRLAAILEDEKMHSMAIDTDAATELRRLHTELERKSDAIQRLWKERDELRSECRTLVRQNGEWQELNAELVKTLKWLDNWLGEKPMPECVDRIRAALAKAQGEQHE